MVIITRKRILEGIKKDRFEASYRCLPYFNEYSIFFPDDALRFIFIIGRNYALIEGFVEKSVMHIGTIFKITYRPPPSKVNKFESDVYRSYCDVLKSRFHGSFSEFCTTGVNTEYCPVLGNTIYSLYFHLDNDYIYPFLSRLLRVRYHIEYCTPFMIRTRNITLTSSGVFSYRDRFSFSNDIVRFSINCKDPSASIRDAIRYIIRI